MFPLIRQAAASGNGINESPLWLIFGAVMGIFYTLGIEKYQRTMRHRHRFVRASMLGFSGLCAGGNALFVSYLCFQIYKQSEGIQGVDRIIAVLIPIVVRADLVVDCGRRFFNVLLYLQVWVDAVVQLQRILLRASAIGTLFESNRIMSLQMPRLNRTCRLQKWRYGRKVTTPASINSRS